MKIISDFLIGFVATLHIIFFILEMFLWTTPIGLKVFRQTREQALVTKVLAANQGLYNLFLSIGLFWGMNYSEPTASIHIKLFFLGCVVAAGIYGGWSASKNIILIQAIPGLLAIFALLAN